jgi:hypothetical protein
MLHAEMKISLEKHATSIRTEMTTLLERWTSGFQNAHGGLKEYVDLQHSTVQEHSEKLAKCMAMAERYRHEREGLEKTFESQLSNRLHVEGAKMIAFQLQSERQFGELREVIDNLGKSQQGMQSNQASAIAVVRHSLGKAEMQQQVDHAYLESALRNELQAERKWCASEVQSVDMDVQASHGTQRALLIDTCKKTEAALQKDLSESLASIRASLEGHVEELSSKTAKIDCEVRRTSSEHAEELLRLRREMEAPLERLRQETVEFSKQRVAELQEALRAEKATMCQSVTVQVMSQMITALEGYKVDFQDSRRKRFEGDAANTSDWKELIADVRDVLSKKYMEGLKACRVAEETISSNRRSPHEVAAVVAEQFDAQTSTRAGPAPPANGRCRPVFPSRTPRASTPLQHSTKWQDIQQARRTSQYVQ